MNNLVKLKVILIKLIDFFKSKKTPSPIIIIVNNSNNVDVSVTIEK